MTSVRRCATVQIGKGGRYGKTENNSFLYWRHYSAKRFIFSSVGRITFYLFREAVILIYLFLQSSAKRLSLRHNDNKPVNFLYKKNQNNYSKSVKLSSKINPSKTYCSIGILNERGIQLYGFGRQERREIIDLVQQRFALNNTVDVL